MSWLRKLLGLCFHQWDIYAHCPVHGETWSGEPGIVGYSFILRCKHCGDITSREVS